MLALRSTSGGSIPVSDARDEARRARWPATSAWLPVALLGAGLALGLALWSKWGFAVAFEAIRTYCF